ncbi:4Fe-4S dicluster domain-containing protein [Heliophilum fasciatum]|uniref:4Fe-4S dicluster protein n=1 Tax=Heliophilum fasciatum TaxID=35700 RepID=A0A4R2RKB4_9FIRM|nr:4Fe-4S dicluster domain-containing protein [Heliophilum fasciatum]MCW2278652.1 ferredoxin [Heliophilum fasciatum]TCP62627.1 4Fe-4S dicluster protein [Heliophilum fasciatum]
MKALAKKNLADALALLAGQATVWVPAKVAGVTRFAPWSPAVTLDLEATPPAVSPKEILLPETESLYRYSAYGMDVTFEAVEQEVPPTIIWGIHSCDVQAILCQDDVFLSREPQDAAYAKRRAATTLVALACTTPGPDCFCTSMGLEPAEHASTDVQLHILTDGYGVEARTARGEEIVARLAEKGLLVETIEPPAKAQACTRAVNPEGIDKKLVEMFEHPYWDELAATCLNCGACTFLCPTCHCFDLTDHRRNAHEGTKIRCWDACMFTEYTVMAGGHNPRPGKKERVRQRFMHKLRYFPERYGKWQCTGCGRCVARCPVHIEITDVIKEVGEVTLDG